MVLSVSTLARDGRMVSCLPSAHTLIISLARPREAYQLHSCPSIVQPGPYQHMGVEPINRALRIGDEAEV